MTDALDTTFEELRRSLRGKERLDPTHADPFFTFVHDPDQAIDVNERIANRWKGTLERDGFHVEVFSLCELLWSVVDASGRWEDWIEVERDVGDPGQYNDPNRSMRDVLGDDLSAPAPTRAGLLRTLLARLEKKTPDRLVLLTDMAHLHPWFRVDTLGTALHDKVQGPTVLFYPGRRHGQYGLHFLKLYPEDGGSYRTTILGGL